MTVPPRSYTPMSIPDLIRAAAGRGPDRTAIIAGDEVLRYADLVARMNRVSNAARGIGLGQGDIVALIASNCPEYFAVMAGLSAIGVITATLDPRLTSFELTSILADCDPRLAILDEQACEAFAATGHDCRHVVFGTTYDAWVAAAATTAPGDRIEEWATFAIGYTSGTTGKPKGVLLSHRSRILTALSMSSEYRCFGIDDRFLSTTPLCHGAGFAFGVANLLQGGSVELHPAFDADAVVRALADSRATGVFVVPTMLSRLLDTPGADRIGFGRTSLRTMICNAAACPQPLKARSVDLWGGDLLHETYGSTEGGIVTNIRPADLLRKPGSAGTAFGLTRIELRDPDGNVVQTGEIGELHSRSPYFFNGYHNRPDATAETLRDGWVSVGDLARIDEDAFISIIGRAKDMIVTGGINVYPSEVEAAIAALPGVAEVAVVGAPDGEWGERVQAFVVARDGDRLSEADVRGVCSARLATYKRPKDVIFIASLPRNGAGKILKTRLREGLPG